MGLALINLFSFDAPIHGLPRPGNALPAELVLVQHIQLFVHQLPQLRGVAVIAQARQFTVAQTGGRAGFHGFLHRGIVLPVWLAQFSQFFRQLEVGLWLLAQGMQAAPALCPISQMRFIKHTTARHRLLEQLRHAGSGQRVHVFKQGTQRQNLASIGFVATQQR